jgi:hypothetical protein
MLRRHFAVRATRPVRASSSSCTSPAAAPLIEPLESRRLLTVLIFQPATGSYGNGAVLSQNYGDRVTAATQNGFKYGTTGGTTAHVTATYGGTGYGTATTWSGGYGNLQNIVYPNPNGTKFKLTLTADSGYDVTLKQFDLGGYGADYTINSVKVLNAAGTAIYTKSSVKVWGTASGAHTTISFATPLKSPKLTVVFDSTNLGGGGYNVGIDNVQFGEALVQKTTISGSVFNDANADGLRGTTEAKLSGWRVFVDTNNNGMFDPTERAVLTDLAGNYSMTFTSTGTFVVRVQLISGYYQTAPHALAYTVHAPGGSIANALFGVKQIAPA